MFRTRPALAAAALLALLAIAVAGYVYWRHAATTRLPEGIAVTNGRIEAEQIEIATKIPGRVTEILVEEGDMVKAGDVIARLDSVQIEAQLRGAEAQLRQAEHAKAQADAVIVQRTSERDLARQEFERGRTLHATGNMPTEALDKRRSAFETAEAGYKAAAAALQQASAAVDAAAANVAQIKSVLADTVLTAPRSGRIQYRLANPGEVLAAGGRVATLLDLTDVYMTIFLPARDAGRLAFGAEARLILDPAPQYVIPATVSFVASEAQFTPKSVETSAERDSLMFRVKLKIAPELLKKYESQVKTGVRGIAYVRVRGDAVWPERLAVKLP
ncbi:MAG TPA: HlyD family efflux transporter periplasmic adaptor subunit [Alphaproteobacteria bacterium]|jgi:HlyD family secretion protein|nr:HlyD family efflux transporter periplasmic adaptor subunit [Alphaproteobacteria bacterium]